MTYFESIIIAIVEGLTEFLPISSTGHMILASKVLGIENSEFLKTFEISIQLGAIMAIVIIYAKRFLKSWEIYKKLTISFIPTAIIGYFSYHMIKEYLFSPVVVSISLILGGIILILVDRKLTYQISNYEEAEKISYKRAFFIGLIQSISIIPGVSRAGASIVGGVFNGLNKKQAIEFSFLLAVPTMFAATGYDLYKTPLVFSHHEISLLLVGLCTAFVFAWIAVKAFLVLINKLGFAYFGWYRIFIGILFLILIYMKII